MGANKKPVNSTCILLDDAEDETTSAPTTVTDGIKVPNLIRRCAHLLVEKSAASGTRTYAGLVWGYLKHKVAQTQEGNEVLTHAKEANSGAWFPLFYTPAEGETESETEDFNRAYPMEPFTLLGFDRVYHQVLTNGGTTPVLTTSIMFSGEDL